MIRNIDRMVRHNLPCYKYQLFCVHYRPVVLLTWFSYTRQEPFNTRLETGPAFVVTPPSVAEQICANNNFTVCSAPEEVVDDDDETETEVDDTVPDEGGDNPGSGSFSIILNGWVGVLILILRFFL